MPFQVNTVVRKGALDTLDAVYGKAMSEGATRLDLFFLVPTGRGRGIDALVPDDSEVKSAIEWSRGRRVKLTCCPQAGTCIGGREEQVEPCRTFRHRLPVHGDFRRMVESAENPLGACGNCRQGGMG